MFLTKKYYDHVAQNAAYTRRQEKQ